MYKFAVTLHVLAAVLVIGPLVLAALSGARAVRRHDPAGTRAAATMLSRANIGTVVVALLGFWAVSGSDRASFRTPWVVISITLWIVMGAVASALATPALRKAAKILDEGVPARPQAQASQPEGDESASPAQYSATATELAAKERLDHLIGRIASSGALVTLTAVAIVVFMVVKPFGD
ncbi:MAG: DUF2269 family protein [Micromonosporaceae bacterium]|nr:DUF2269 family protein [Micromonosporaceae bacterium]